MYLPKELTARSAYCSTFQADIYLKILLLVICAIKIPFIFHGKWDEEFFVPFMTDETVFLSPIYSYVTTGNFNLDGLCAAYPPFLFNILFPFFYLLFKILFLLTDEMRSVSIYEIIYYNSRMLVLLCATIGSLFYVKVFKDMIRSTFYQAVLLILINLNSLFFLYSGYLKTDELVWAFGAISIYFGLLFWKEPSRGNYIKFYLLSILPVCINYNGYIYFLNFIVVSFIVKSQPFIRNRVKLFLIFILAPLLWLVVNFELISRLSDVCGMLFRSLSDFSTQITKGRNVPEMPFLEGANGYSSFHYYLDYLRYHLISPIVIFCALLIFFLKNPNSYYRIVGAIFAIFFIHISFITFRTDRLFLPVFIFAILLIVYFFYFCHVIVSRTKLRWLIVAVTIVFTIFVLGETITLVKSWAGKDTRHHLYKYISKSLPTLSDIFFIHLTIAGAHSTAQRLNIDSRKEFNTKEFNIKVIYLDEKEKAVDSLSALKGYFVLSSVDLDILKDNKETRYYSEQYKALQEVLKRSMRVTYIDRINYAGQPFGPTSMIPNSLYGIHNPPFFVYRTDDTLVKPSIKEVDEVPYEVRFNESHKIIDIALDRLVVSSYDKEGGSLEYDINRYGSASWKKVLSQNEEMHTALLVSNNTNSKIDLYLKYLGKSQEGVDLGFGFSNKEFAGRRFIFGTWVKANKVDCISLGFYKGNIRVIGWGEPNELDVSDKYEFLYYESKFDQPYSANGNIRYKIERDCTVELTCPQFILFD